MTDQTVNLQHGRHPHRSAPWYARRTIVARRRATLAARAGREAWAARWGRLALVYADAWRDMLDARR